MSLIGHPACGVVQHTLQDVPVLGDPPTRPDPALDVARLRSRLVNIDGWQHLAACRGLDPLVAIPETDEVLPARAAACARCTVRIDCLEWGVERIQQSGVLGGYPQSDRRKIRAMLVRGWSQR
jgi:hypothetical protein